MKYEKSWTGRFEISQVPLFEWSEDRQRFIPLNEPPLSCAHWCRICVDIERSIEMHPSMGEDGRDPCTLCPDCSGAPE